MMRADGEELQLVTQFKCERSVRPILQGYRDRYLVLVFPSCLTMVIDYRAGEFACLATLSPLLPSTCLLQAADFKSVVLDEQRLMIFMTSKRPNVDLKGNSVKAKRNQDDVGNRMIVTNSQIYTLDIDQAISSLKFKHISTLNKEKFETKKHKHNFQLQKLTVDNRTKNYTSYGVFEIDSAPDSLRKLLLLFGGQENPQRYTLLYDGKKREIVKCSIYTGD